MANKWKEAEGKEFNAVYQVGHNENGRIAELLKYVKFIKKHVCVVVYGTGYIAEKLYFLFERFDKKIIFCDQKASSKEYCFHSMRVISPQTLKENYVGAGVGILVTATDSCEEIQTELEAAGIPEIDIMKASKEIAPETVF